MISAIIFLAFFAVAADGSCPNHCSGHGTCSADDVCNCHDNWGTGLGLNNGGDCKDRMCPKELSWSDSPDGGGNFHQYETCSGRGICDFKTGECDCVDGYDGKACQRQTCPNDCSGHGTCEYIDDLAFGKTYGEFSGRSFRVEPKQFDVYAWNSHKSRACKCDGNYFGPDCSKQRCPHGNDVLDTRPDELMPVKYQKQTIIFQSLTSNCYDRSEDSTQKANTRTFALQYTSVTGVQYVTQAINFKCQASEMDEFAMHMSLALARLPNRASEGVTVKAKILSNDQIEAVFEFKGCYNEGNQNFLAVLADWCGNGCTPKITGLELQNFWGRFEGFDHVTADPTDMATSNITVTQKADYNSYECGRHGSCDYTDGQCSCFSGYSGIACGVQDNLV